jgi:uncharacterized protein
MTESALYVGVVRHLRHAPVRHEFSYRVHQLWLALEELPQVFDGHRGWSARGPAIAWFRRDDHLGDPCEPLDRSVRALVERETGRRPSGPIRLLTHPRYFGYVMNPVSFFYCFAPDGAALEAIVAQIDNTPWGERHCYVLSAAAGCATSAGELGFEFDKAFHVSPFMPMQQRYAWRFTTPGQTLGVHMKNLEAGETRFEASLVLQRRGLDSAALRAALLGFPPMTLKVVGAIYWNALRLWLKGAPFFDHPASTGVARSSRYGSPPTPRPAETISP